MCNCWNMVVVSDSVSTAFHRNNESLVKATKFVLLLDNFVQNADKDHDTKDRFLPNSFNSIKQQKVESTSSTKRFVFLSCKRKCNRCPVAVNCNTVDVARINASFLTFRRTVSWYFSSQYFEAVWISADQRLHSMANYTRKNLQQNVDGAVRLSNLI